MILIRHGQSEFNVVYSVTRVDPGIRDARLTPLGRQQAAEAADALAGEGLTRLIASPYMRTLETATIIAGRLGLPIEVDALVRERSAFACDLGASRRELARTFPALAFDHLDEPWFHDHEALGVPEPEAAILARADAFRRARAGAPDWDTTAVVTHWGMIRALTGRVVANAERVRLPRELPLWTPARPA